MEAEAGKRKFQRSQFAVVLVLAPLNGTFERKCLIVPFAPDVLKLGRQTTSRTHAAPDNGYFDSRVLSRQHAEIWADYDSGKVYLHDAKSSNGTYINKKRLSAENTESEPFELKTGDFLDLGIDITCNDESKQMYKRISAKVEKVSMLPLHVGLQQRQQRQETPLKLPSLSRSPSLETLKSARSVNLNGSEAIFGKSTSIETMALSHANTTAGGQLVKDSVKTHVNFELAAKRLVAQIREVRADTAKIQSINTMLEEIKRAAVEAEEKEKAIQREFETERQQLLKLREEGKHASKSSSLAALKAENTRMRAELSHIKYPDRSRRRGVSIVNRPEVRNEQLRLPVEDNNELKDQEPDTDEAESPQVARFSNMINLPKLALKTRRAQNSTVIHNIMVLIGTATLVTIIGVWIMFFFNPPVAPQSSTPFLFRPIGANTSTS